MSYLVHCEEDDQEDVCSDDGHHDVLLCLLPPKKTAAVFSTYIKNRGSQLVYLFFFSEHTQVSCTHICPKAKTQTETGAQKSAHAFHSISLPSGRGNKNLQLQHTT